MNLGIPTAADTTFFSLALPIVLLPTAMGAPTYRGYEQRTHCARLISLAVGFFRFRIVAHGFQVGPQNINIDHACNVE
jgi:hypothetical protein